MLQIQFTSAKIPITLIIILCTFRFLKSRKIYAKTYGIQKISGLYLSAPTKSSRKSAHSARVIPQPGHGMPRKCKKTQEIPVCHITKYTIVKYTKNKSASKMRCLFFIECHSPNPFYLKYFF